MLLCFGQNRGCAWIVGPSISQTVQSQGPVSVQHLARTGHGILRQCQKFSLTLAFGKKREQLCPATSGGAGAGPENDPEVGSGVLKFNRRMKGSDPRIPHFLIGIGISSIASSSWAPRNPERGQSRFPGEAVPTKLPLVAADEPQHRWVRRPTHQLVAIVIRNVGRSTPPFGSTGTPTGRRPV